jgi:hypothetical protein
MGASLSPVGRRKRASSPSPLGEKEGPTVAKRRREIERAPVAATAETDLYAPVKAFLEGQGYTVRGEVRHCDLVAVRGGEPPVIVELKRQFTLGLVLQGVDRLALSDAVYLAVPAGSSRRSRAPRAEDGDVRTLCRRVGLGLMVVHRGRAAATVEVLVDPLPYRPRRDRKRQALLLAEHARRHGDHNCGGSTRTPIVTAYREEALRCAALLEGGPLRVAELRRRAAAPNAGRILQRDVYGWFERRGRGVYGLSPGGRKGLATFAHALPPTPL